MEIDTSASYMRCCVLAFLCQIIEMNVLSSEQYSCRDHFVYMRPANEIWCYNVTPFLIGWVHAEWPLQLHGRENVNPSMGLLPDT